MTIDFKFEQIMRAQKKLEGVITKQNIFYSNTISNLSSNNIYIKPENLQKTGSFKIRGAYNKIANLDEEEKIKGVIASSAGNHAQGVALGATSYGVKSTIVMPIGAPISKVVSTKNYGAEVVLFGDSYDEAYEKALEIQKDTGAVFIHPFDDLAVIAGQGTIGLEIIEELPEVDAIFVPVGGGGLISGVALAVKSINPKVKIIGVEPYLAASMSLSIEKGKISTLDRVNTIADGIAVKTPGKNTFEIIRKYVDDIVTVSDGEISQAILALLEKEKLVAEGAGAASLAAVLTNKLRLNNKKIVTLISGGNIDLNIISNIIEKGLLESGRKYEVKVMIPDRPGQLQVLLGIITEIKANISSIFQTRVKPYVDIGYQEVSMVLDTKDHEHIKIINKKLLKKGYNIIN